LNLFRNDFFTKKSSYFLYVYCNLIIYEIEAFHILKELNTIRMWGTTSFMIGCLYTALDNMHYQVGYSYFTPLGFKYYSNFLAVKLYG